MTEAALPVALSPFFWKGVAVTIAALVLFIGSIYILLSAVFGPRMAYLVLAVSLFGWMMILSALWAFGAPGTPPNLGPRGYEPHWVVFASGTGTIQTSFAETGRYPGAPWEPVGEETASEAETVNAVVQEYLAGMAQRQLEEEGIHLCETEARVAGSDEECLDLPPTQFTVQDMRFAQSGDTRLVGARAFYRLGGPEITVFARFDKGNVAKYSWAFLGASVLGFVVHLPFLDRAERRRKEVLTGGTAPPWYGPA